MAKPTEPTEKVKNLGGVTDAQLAAWKKQYGEDDVKPFEVALDDDGKRKVGGYLRKPDPEVLSAFSAIQQHQPYEAGEVLFKNCFLGGDPEVSDQLNIRMSVILALKRIHKIRIVEIKEV